MPFGLSSAPQVFTELLQPIVGLLRLRGISVYIYLDDILVMAPFPTMVQDAVRHTVQVLLHAGFLINLSKSELSPTSGYHLHRRLVSYGSGYDFSTPGQERGSSGVRTHIPQGGPIQTSPPLPMPPRSHGGLLVGGQTGQTAHETNPVACQRPLVPSLGPQRSNYGDSLTHVPPPMVAVESQPRPIAYMPPTTVTGHYGHNGCQPSRLGRLP